MFFKQFIILSLLITGNFTYQNLPMRQLLIFAQNKSNHLLIKQLQELANEKKGLAERSVKIITVEKTNGLYKKYSVDENEFTIILIGKDGEEKYRTSNFFSAENLFTIIDAMPMRKAEMKIIRGKHS